MAWDTQAESSPGGMGRTRGSLVLAGQQEKPRGKQDFLEKVWEVLVAHVGRNWGSMGTGIAPGVHKTKQGPRESLGTGAPGGR